MIPSKPGMHFGGDRLNIKPENAAEESWTAEDVPATAVMSGGVAVRDSVTDA